MIRIVRGVYGFVDSDGAVHPKTVKDEPFSVDAEKEKRLVEQGVAVFVDEPKTEAKAEPKAEPKEETKEEPKKKPSKKKNAKKDETEEPPVIEAVDPE